MNPFALSGLLVLITTLSLGIFILLKTPTIFPNRLWAYFNFAVGLWGLSAYEATLTHNPQSAILWWNIAHIAIIILPILDLHFSQYFLEIKNRKLITFIYLIGLFFLIILFSKHLITHVKFIFNSFYYPSNASTLYISFCFFWITIVVYKYQLAYNKIRKTSEKQRNEIKYFFLSTSIGYVGGVDNFLPIFGINLYPYGNFLIAAYPIIMTIVILKYNLMDINIILWNC